MARCLQCNSSYDPRLGHGPEDCRIARVDSAIGKQLQASMERNARMVNRLRRLLDKPVCSREVVHDELRSAVESILKDEEPQTWPAA